MLIGLLPDACGTLSALLRLCNRVEICLSYCGEDRPFDAKRAETIQRSDEILQSERHWWMMDLRPSKEHVNGKYVQGNGKKTDLTAKRLRHSSTEYALRCAAELLPSPSSGTPCKAERLSASDIQETCKFVGACAFHRQQCDAQWAVRRLMTLCCF